LILLSCNYGDRRSSCLGVSPQPPSRKTACISQHSYACLLIYYHNPRRLANKNISINSESVDLPCAKEHETTWD
jgi:hypothetical protein